MRLRCPLPWPHAAENCGGAAEGRGNLVPLGCPMRASVTRSTPSPAVDPRGDLHSGVAPGGGRLFTPSDWQSGSTVGGTPIGTPRVCQHEWLHRRQTPGGPGTEEPKKSMSMQGATWARGAVQGEGGVRCWGLRGGRPPPPAHGAVAEEISGTTGVKPQEFATSLRK